MTYSEVKKELKKEFTLLLKSAGYKSKCSSQGCEFILQNINSSNLIGYGIVNYIDEFDTGCHLGIGIQEIQEIEKEIFNGSFYGTLSLSISNYFNEVNYRYKIKTENDIKEWMDIVQKFFTEFAQPFFEKYKTVADIDKLFNTNPKERVPELDDLGQHIIKGLISAKLNENPTYEELKSFYKNEVETKFKGHFMYDNCMQAIFFLDNHSLSELKTIANPTQQS